MDMLWCQGELNIRLSNSKVKSALKCTVWSQCTHIRPSSTKKSWGS